MSQVQIRRQDAGLLRVEGNLVFETAGRLLQEGESLLEGRTTACIDLGGVRDSDSAGLALLLEWLDRARARGCSLRFRNIPESLWRIARLSNLESLLPVTDREPEKDRNSAA